MASSPQPSPSEAESTVANRRTSARVSKQPQRFADTTPLGSAKRKRSDEDDEGIGLVDDDADDDEDSEEDTEGEPDEEEVREKRRATRSAKAARNKPIVKKSRANGSTIDLAIRTTNNRPKQSRRAARTPAPSGSEVEGLFGNDGYHSN